MTTTTSDVPAAQVLRASIDLLRDGDLDGYLELFDADVVMEFPFAPEGAPQRLTGLEEVRTYLDGYPDLLHIEAVSEWTAHRDADDAEVVLVEFALEGRVVATDRPYRMGYVAVVRVVGGKIVRYRDYWSPDAAREALGAELLGGDR
ncbi:nuclear transport factor 2 family protein [Auraticoccus monumenti]|nr:nuclear transport factor 2 family protein [Auraticoccus monumenti]